MTFTLETCDERRSVLVIDNLTWRATLALLERFGVLDAGALDRLGIHVWTQVSARQSRRVATFLEGYLPGTPAAQPGERDRSVATAPDTAGVHRDDLARHHSPAMLAWLGKLRDFCATATNGFGAG